MIVMSIAGVDPSGGAGILADIKTFQALGVYGTGIVTALTAQNPQMMYSLKAIETDYVEEQIDVALGTDNVMFNKPDMFREMEYTLKAVRGSYKNKITAHDVLKMATINGFKILGKDVSIQEGNISDILVIRQKSEDPYLSIVNRSSSEDIVNFIMGNQM